ncbi:MAG: DivIVA domain-containing protein [candidate division WOR-3 bacterium]|nr:MAG: DivIVA domain-containing protein [candidate division WOR-3 bacterium]
MPITPLDIRKKTFSSQLRGLSVREVKTFLELVAKEMEELRKERGLLAEKVDELAARIENYERTEKLLKETLVTAQQTSEQMKAAASEQYKALRSQAEHEAGDRIRKAEQEAEAVLQKAREQLQRATADIRELETRQGSLLDQVEAVGHSCMMLVESWKSGMRKAKPKSKPAPEPRASSGQDMLLRLGQQPETAEPDTPSEPESEYVEED